MTRKAAKTADRRIEYVPLRELRKAKRNPKGHDLDTLSASVGRFGYVEPVVLDERTGRLVAGHGRVELLAKLEKDSGKPPSGVRLGNGKGWLVPVVRGWASKDDAEAEAYLLASNRTSELGGWDDAGLAELLKDLAAKGALEGTGYGQEDLDRLLAEAGAGPVEGEDDVPETPPAKDVWVKPGDMFSLGRHRLLCGDSTKAEDVKRVMGGERAGLMNTDPPYGVAYANDERPNPGVAKPRVANDGLADEALQRFLESAFSAAVAHALKPDAAWYMWHAHLTQGYFAAAAAAAAANVVLHRQIIWVKPVLLLGRGQYHWKHEPCFMGWVKGNTPPDYGEGKGERTQTTVWEIDSVTTAERRELDHSTPKPVRLFEIPVVKHLKPGEVAFEPFSGSGPQIIACEKSARACRAIELEPKYVQVALERWEKFTGKKAKKVSR